MTQILQIDTDKKICYNPSDQRHPCSKKKENHENRRKSQFFNKLNRQNKISYLIVWLTSF